MANIGSEANIGNNAEIGASAGIGEDAKIGAKAYGAQEDPVPPTPQGVVLYDGAVTLDEEGEGSVVLDGEMVLGHPVTLTYDGNEYLTVVYLDEGEEAVVFGNDDIEILVYSNGNVSASDGNGDPITGEISIKLVQDAIPELTTLYEGTVALTLQGGEIPEMKGSFTLDRALNEGEFVYVYSGGVLRNAIEYYSGDVESWYEDENTYTVTFSETDCYCTTDDINVNSVNLKIAVPTT